MKKILFASAASAALLAATPALAQDAQDTTAVSGPRVEALVGYDRVKIDGEHDGGVLFGIGAGYDFAVGNGVSLGADVEATESTQKEGDADVAQVKAGRDLYASGRGAFMHVTLPLTMPGIVAAAILTFIPALGDYVTPDLLGGAQTTTIAKIVQIIFTSGRDWP